MCFSSQPVLVLVMLRWDRCWTSTSVSVLSSRFSNIDVFQTRSSANATLSSTATTFCRSASWKGVRLIYATAVCVWKQVLGQTSTRVRSGVFSWGRARRCCFKQTNKNKKNRMTERERTSQAGGFQISILWILLERCNRAALNTSLSFCFPFMQHSAARRRR